MMWIERLLSRSSFDGDDSFVPEEHLVLRKKNRKQIISNADRLRSSWRASQSNTLDGRDLRWQGHTLTVVSP